MLPSLDRRHFLAGLSGVTALGIPQRSAAGPDAASSPATEHDAAIGPMVGHVDTERARIWFRPAVADRAPVDWRLTVKSTTDGDPIAPALAKPDPDHDATILFEVRGLQPATSYTFELAPAAAGDRQPTATGSFRTPPADGAAARVVLGFGSCAPSKPSHVWTRIVDEGCEGFVLLGDTPYLDTGDLATARQKHRTFLAQPELAAMLRSLPTWATWDDHDFGGNDSHGDHPAKHTTRLAFTEYRANATFGHDDQGRPQSERFGAGRGIYTRFRHGPIEVFLLDPRWFSRTEPSFADPRRPTCLGAGQWRWLCEQLQRSDAPFKVLATGMIWHDKKNQEQDDWETYAHEREVLLDRITSERIPGCLLLGGDIHLSRALNHGQRVGYELWDLVVSPLHEHTIPSLDHPHPALVHRALAPHVFLRMVADSTVTPATLTATWIDRDGKRWFEIRTDAARLRP